MQTDGNLVEDCGTGAATRAVFDTRGVAPAGPDGDAVSAIAVMQSDGNFVVHRTVFGEPTGEAFSTRTGGAGDSFVLQTDTNLVVYGPGGRPRWSRVTGLF